MASQEAEAPTRRTQSDPADTHPWWVTDGALEFAGGLPASVAERLEALRGREPGETPGGVVVARASELVGRREEALPGWIGTETFFLVFDDVPTPALMRLPTLLRLHKPDRRLHVTGDPRALRRLVVARSRRAPWEGIVDAYALADELVLVLGDLTVRSIPRERVPEAADLAPEAFASFTLDEDGSGLRWPAMDLDLGVASLLQAVDPASLAEAEIERIAREDTGAALRAMRQHRGLRQRDVPGLSERQVRRLEKSRSRLTAGAARRYAEAFELPLEGFLERLGTRLGQAEEETRGA